MAEPSVRASLVKMVLRRATAVWPDDAPAIRAALGPDALARMARTPGYEWVPIAYEVAIVRAVHALHGDDGVRRLGLEIGRAGMEHALLRPMVTAVFGMLGRRPAALAKIAAGGWAIATRNAGRVSVASREGGAVHFALDDLPDVLRDRAMFLRMGASGEAIFALAGLATGLEIDWTPGSASARLHLSWRRRE